MADLDEIMSGSGGDSATEQQPAQVTTEQNPREDGRDEHGRFASQQPAEPQPPATQEQRPPEGYVPIQALDARLAKERERYETQLQQRDLQIQQYLRQSQQPQAAPKPPPDFFENPDAAVDYRVQEKLRGAVDPIQQQLMFNAKLVAQSIHKEKLDPAIRAFDDAVASGQIDHADVQRVRGSPNPFHAAVEWHSQRSALQTYGSDPEAYIQAEVQKRIDAMQQQAPQTQQPPVLPTNFAGTRNSGPSTAQAFSGPRPLSEIMNGR